MPISERLGHHVKRAEQELIAAKHAALRPYNLNPAQYTAMLVLSEEPGLSGAALARRCLVTPQTMSSVLNTLEGRGFVTRKPHPIHTHILEACLSPTGKKLLAKADEAASLVEQALTDEFEKDERAQFLGFLKRWSEALTRNS